MKSPRSMIARAVGFTFVLALSPHATPSSSAEKSATRSQEAVASIASPEAGWPQFRGPRRDGISHERDLLPSWPEGGPPRRWSVGGAGRGFSSPVIADGRVYVTGDFNEDLFLVAYDLDGKPLWRARNGASWLNQYQGARATITYSAGRLYHQNAHGRLACFDAATGRELWAVNLLERFRGENITWGLSECVIVDERAVYATAGGRDAFLVAFDKRNGNVLWQSAPLPDASGQGAAENAGYAAPILVSFAGRRLIIGSSQRLVFCADADTGKMQWTLPRPTSYAVLAMSPLVVSDGIFITAPYGPPGACYRLVQPTSPDAPVGVKEIWTTSLDTAQGCAVHVNGTIYGAYYPRRGGWVALDAATGKAKYEAPEFVKGAPLYADHRLYALCEDGWMLLLEPTATQFEVRGRFRLATARDRDAWAHPSIHDGRLYLRYHDTLACYDLRAQRGSAASGSTSGSP